MASIPGICSRAPVAAPNPFRVESRITFDGSQQTPTMLQIYSASGRLVRSLGSRDFDGDGFASVVWDGRDDLGRDVPAGIYWVLSQSPRGFRGWVARGKLVKVN